MYLNVKCYFSQSRCVFFNTIAMSKLRAILAAAWYFIVHYVSFSPSGAKTIHRELNLLGKRKS